MTTADPPIGSLERALQYRNDEVVHKFLERFDMTFEEAAELFEETKKWLWLESPGAGKRLVVTHEMSILDEMWHTFILFTPDYADYCNNYLGRFVHHVPTTKTEKDAYAADPDAARARMHELMRDEFHHIADQLGPETLFKWFVEYPRRYGPEFFATRLKPFTPSLSAELLQELDDIAGRYDPEAVATSSEVSSTAPGVARGQTTGAE